MKSKFSVILMILMLCFFFSVGCGSSEPEEISVIQQELPDFKEVVQRIKLNGVFDPRIEEANPEIEKRSNLDNIFICRIIIYRTKSGGLRIATMNKSRPPIITGLSREF